MSVDDVLALEQLGPVEQSPDGQWWAAVIERGKTPSEHRHDNGFMGVGSDRGDIWLLPIHGGVPRNLTRGLDDGTSHFNPVWSPDGRRLAFVSTRGGDAGILPYVWEAESGTIVRLSDRPIDSEAMDHERPFGAPMLLWADTTTLVFAVSAPQSDPLNALGGTLLSQRAAIRQWEMAARGDSAAVSVLDSGREVPDVERPHGALLAVDVRTSRIRVLLEGNVRRLLPSPNGREVAVITETGRVPPHPTSTMPMTVERAFAFVRSRLAIVAFDGGTDPEWADGVPDPKLWYGDSPHSWSPDGSTLAVVAKTRPGDETVPVTVWTVSGASGLAQRAVTGNAVDVVATAWTGDGRLLALARTGFAAQPDSTSQRRDWWEISPARDAGALKLTAMMPEPPASLRRGTAKGTMVGVAAGDLWEIDVRRGAIRNRTAGFAPRIIGVAWPSAIDQDLRRPAELVLETLEDGFFRWDQRLSGTPPLSLRAPSVRGSLLSYGPATGAAAFQLDSREGTLLWTSDSAGHPFELRLTLNAYLHEVANARRVLIDYQDVEGDSLRALLLLPIDYRPGQRCPTVVYVYNGRIITDSMSYSPVFEKWFASSLNIHPLLSRGYAVLVPSMPTRVMGRRYDALIDLPKGVMSAVDRAIALGFVDSDRLGLLGHSLGGYTAISLVAYTGRFKAAVAAAGFANEASMYGAFVPSLRRGNYPHEHLWTQQYLEGSLTSAGLGTPWGNLWGYLQNSPYYLVDRISTPLLLIQGDFDHVPMQQGEELFTALYRLGKRARFVRYWGESHVVESPANARDQWQRIFDWFDDYVRVDDSPGDRTHGANGAGTDK